MSAERRTRLGRVELVTIRGEDDLLYRSLPVDVAVIRGTTASERDNVTMEDEACFGEQLSSVAAARNRGGTVVCQVKRLATAGALRGSRSR